MTEFVDDILELGLAGESITGEQAKVLVSLTGDDLMGVVHAAGKVARKFKGKDVSLCTIVNARSGTCSENCRFCAQSAHHSTGVETYPLMSKDELLEAARKMDAEGADRFGIVTSGKGVVSDEAFTTIIEAVKAIGEATSLEVCASLGVLEEEQFLRLKEAGLVSYHHNIETAPSYYPEICTTHPYELRADTVRAAKRAGLDVCCGGIIGLGESWEHRIEFAFAVKDLDPDSIPINVLNPVRGTPLEDRPLTDPMDVLKTIALVRFVNPTKSIRYAGGREVNMGDLQALGLIGGLDGMLTGNYLTTTGRDPDQDKKMVRGLGLNIKRG